MKNKNHIFYLLIGVMLSVCMLAFVACNKDRNAETFKIPEFSTVGEMIDLIDSGEFAFGSVTFTVEEYDNDELINKTEMKCSETMSYSVSQVSMLGIPTKSELYAIPDLTDNCVYTIMNNFLTNGWGYMKDELTYDDFNGKNFASIALKSYLKTNEVPMNTAVKIENNSISFETETLKFKIYGFDSTSVELPNELIDYKSKC